jgi:hypothetical protein
LEPYLFLHANGPILLRTDVSPGKNQVLCKYEVCHS